MNTKRKAYTVKKRSVFRRATADLLKAAQRKNMIHAMVEADITTSRIAIRNLRKENKSYLSLLGYILYCTAKTINKHKQVQAYRNWQNKLIIFDDVDVSTTIERKINGNSEVLPSIIRTANNKNMFEISEEIKNAKTSNIKESEVFKSIHRYLAIPVFIRRLVFKILDRSPFLMKKKAGTVMVTSAGAGNNRSSWGIPVASHTLNVTIGGIQLKQVLVNGELENREYLCLTLSFDHNIIDGAPAARFIRDFLKMIETGLNKYVNQKEA